MADEIPTTAIARFWAKVKKREGDDCWQWMGKLHRSGGYAMCAIQRKQQMAARVAYELEKGPIAPDLVLTCTCNNRGCVRPSHWVPMTEAEAREARVNKTHFQIMEALPPTSLDQMFHVQHLAEGSVAPATAPTPPEPQAPARCSVLPQVVPVLRRLSTDIGSVSGALPQLATTRDIAAVSRQIAGLAKAMDVLGARMALLEARPVAPPPPTSAPATPAEATEPPAELEEDDPGRWLDDLWARVGSGPPEREQIAALFDAALLQRPHGAAALYLVLEWGRDFRRHVGRAPQNVAELETFVAKAEQIIPA